MIMLSLNINQVFNFDFVLQLLYIKQIHNLVPIHFINMFLNNLSLIDLNIAFYELYYYIDDIL